MEYNVEKQHAKGKLHAIERINALCDKDSFVETYQGVKHNCTSFGMDKKDIPYDGVITGFGKINGRKVAVYAQDFTIQGGSLGHMHGRKIADLTKMAIDARCPVIGINDSGGARIQEGVEALGGYGNVFNQNVRASGAIPQISIIAGPCAGGAVYSPGITDFIFTVDKVTQMFITGPNVIKTVTGEIVTSEQLGGARTHNTISGVAHFMGANDEETLMMVRELLTYLPSNNKEMPPAYACTDDVNRLIPEFNTIIPDNPNKAYDMYDIIRGIADDGKFFDVMPLYAKNIITCFIRMAGSTVGVIANQPAVGAGCLDINASDKAARFVRRCDAFNIPVLTLEDVPGFLPGTNQEYGGIIRHGAKLLYAYCEATVPKVTMILRKAYGGAYIAMCNKELGSDMVLAWPSAQIAVMGAEGAVNIMSSVKKELKEADDPEALRKQRIDEYEELFNNPYYAAGLGYVDDVIEPATARQRIISALDMLKTKRETLPPKKHGDIPL